MNINHAKQQSIPDEMNSQLKSSMVDSKTLSSIETLREQRKLRAKLITESLEYRLEEEITDMKQKIKVQNQLREQLSEQINTKELGNVTYYPVKLKIDRKDIKNPMHSLFRWCSLMLYRVQPECYCWEQFKKQVLVTDKGVDFKHRLGCMSLLYLSSTDSDRTKYLLNLRDQIIKMHPNMNTIFDIIEIIYQCHLTALKIQQTQQVLLDNIDKVETERSRLQQVNQSIQELKQLILADQN